MRSPKPGVFLSVGDGKGGTGTGFLVSDVQRECVVPSLGKDGTVQLSVPLSWRKMRHEKRGSTPTVDKTGLAQSFVP